MAGVVGKMKSIAPEALLYRKELSFLRRRDRTLGHWSG